MKIKGIPVGTNMPRSDWNQDDPRKADYIKNKPTSDTTLSVAGRFADAKAAGDALEEARMRDISASRLNDVEKAAFATVNGEGFLTDPLFLKSNSLSGFATWVYRQIGVEVSAYLSSVHKTFGKMFDTGKDADGYRYRRLTLEEGADPYCVAMLLEGSYSGKSDNMQHYGYEYTLELADYKIGDIFCMRYADTLDGVYGDSCYYMALYQAENTFILYQDFGPHEQATNPSNVRVIDYAGLTNIINNSQSVYYYVLRPENIAVMDLMEVEKKQSDDTTALSNRIAEVEKKQSDDTTALSNRIDELSGKLRDMNVGKLTVAEKTVLGGLVGSDEPNKGNLKSMAEWAYGKAGIDVTSYITGSVSDAYWNLFPSKCVLRTAPSDYLTMLVPLSYGGSEFTKNAQTSYQLSMDKYQVGDLFCGKYPTSGYWVAVYMGENKFLVRTGATNDPSTLYAFDESNTIYTAQAWLYYFVLRPENIAIADVINLDVDITLEELGVTATAQELNHMAGVTSGVQVQLDGKAASSHKHTVSQLSDLTATATELNHCKGVTSNIQSQLNALDTKIGNVQAGTASGGMQSEFSHYLSSGEITNSGSTYTHVTPGKTSMFYNLTIHALPMLEDDPEESVFYSFVVGYKQIQTATDTLGQFNMYISCFNELTGVFEHMKLTAQRNTSTGVITFTFDGKPVSGSRTAWEFYHIRGFY